MRCNRDAYTYVVLDSIVIGVLQTRDDQPSTPLAVTHLHLLQEWREPMNKREGLASVTVRIASHNITSVLFIKPQVDPTDQPTKLDHDVWALETDETHHSRKSDVCHGQCLQKVM